MNMNKQLLLKMYILAGITLFGLIAVGILGNYLDLMFYYPLTTPVSWLIIQPYINIGGLILTQISSAIIVYTLSAITIVSGIQFLRNNQDQQSRFWWGIALLFVGIGAGLAGTSYQAFGYEFKCQGFAYCIFTSWWELAYMIFTVTGAAAAFIGVAYCTLEKGAQKSWTLYAIISSFVYVIIILLGILLSNEFLLSFEFMLIFIFIGGCILFVQDLLYYHRKKKGLFPKSWVYGWYCSW